MALYVALNEN